MFLSEDRHFSIIQEHTEGCVQNGRAFLYLWVGHGSASVKDVTEVASFFCFKLYGDTT
jgi:hypothetical protein